MSENIRHSEEEPQPYGFWVTTGISTLIFLVAILLSIAMTFAYKLSGILLTDKNTIFPLGLILSLVNFFVIYLFCKAKSGIWSYCKIEIPSRKQISIALIVILGFLAIAELLRYLFKMPIITSWERELFSGASPVQLIFISLSVVVFAPFWEELLFRGFILTGWGRAIGMFPAIILTSLIWAFLHWSQYELFYVVLIVAFGLVVGYLRIKMNNLLVCVFMHFVNNLCCTIYTMYKLDLI